jgi:protein-disulfide isomerase
MLKNIGKLSLFDTEELARCFDDNDMAERILKKAYTAMKALNLNSTPTFFVNGNQVNGAKSYEDFTKILDKYVKNEYGLLKQFI